MGRWTGAEWKRDLGRVSPSPFRGPTHGPVVELCGEAKRSSRDSEKMQNTSSFGISAAKTRPLFKSGCLGWMKKCYFKSFFKLPLLYCIIEEVGNVKCISKG